MQHTRLSAACGGAAHSRIPRIRPGLLLAAALFCAPASQAQESGLIESLGPRIGFMPAAEASGAELGFPAAASEDFIVAVAKGRSAVQVIGADPDDWDAATWLTGPDDAPGFGAGVAISGTRFLVGADQADDGEGSVLVYQRDAASGSIQLLSRIDSRDPAARGFGAALSAQGDWLAVGAPGSGSIAGSVFLCETEGATDAP
jgi:hypothetical protein